jgi:hypothetical protein
MPTKSRIHADPEHDEPAAVSGDAQGHAAGFPPEAIRYFSKMVPSVIDTDVCIECIGKIDGISTSETTCWVPEVINWNISARNDPSI